MKTRLFLPALLLASLFFGNQSVLGASFMLAPPRVELSLRPGSRQNVKLAVLTKVGEGGPDEVMYMRFYVVDFELSNTGEVVFREPGSLKQSASNWIDLETRDFQMHPDERRMIDMNIRVPGAPAGGYYSAIVLEQLPVGGIMRGQKVVHTVRFVTLVELTVEGRGSLQRDAAITKVNVGRVGEKRGSGFTVTVENRGNVHIRGSGQLMVKTAGGGRLASLPLEAGRGTILPNGSRDFTAVLDRLLPTGNYVAEAVIKYGMRGTAVARVPFSVSGRGLVATGTLDAEKTVRFFVDPYWADLTAGPGAFRTVPISVQNGEENHIHVSSKAVDVTFDLDGRLVVSDVAGGPWSCAEWIEIKPAEFDLRPRERRNVIVTVALPKDVVGGRSAQVDFTATKPVPEGTPPLTGSTGTTLILTIPGQVDVAGEISGLRVVDTRTEQGIRFEAVFANKGNVPVAPKGKLVVRSAGKAKETASTFSSGGGQNQVIGEIALDEIMGVVLPEGARRVKASYPAVLGPGDYTAEMVLDYGAADPARATREFTLK
jgi:hypothetical protein